MDTIATCVELMTKDCFMASIDLRDAYYSIPIAETDRKYLKFVWKEQLYMFTCLPMGLACAPRKFVKLLKPVFAHLHARGHISSGYLDDTYLQGLTFESCEKNVSETMELLSNLGFFVHREKSVTIPCQTLEHLGFILDSKNMTVALTEQKYDKLKGKIDNIRNSKITTIRDIASLIGSMVSYMPAVTYGPLYYKQIEIEKISALRQNKGCYEANMTLSDLAISDMLWWKRNALQKPTTINKGKYDLVVFTDASSEGWWATLGQNKCGSR